MSVRPPAGVWSSHKILTLKKVSNSWSSSSSSNSSQLSIAPQLGVASCVSLCLLLNFARLELTQSCARCSSYMQQPCSVWKAPFPCRSSPSLAPTIVSFLLLQWSLSFGRRRHDINNSSKSFFSPVSGDFRLLIATGSFST